MRRLDRGHLGGALLTGAALASWPRPAWADAGLPMLAVVWPASWLALPVVVVVEGLLARRMLKLTTGRALLLSLEANAWSTLAGIPVVWGAFLVVEMVGGALFGRALGSSGPVLQVLLSPFLAAWLPPFGLTSWQVLAAAAFLCVPFYFMSVWVEGRCAARRAPEAKARTWARWANAATYGPAVLVLIVAATVSWAGSG